tara:strand:- start:6542 stop:7456 length:915 start_codon:yes stop_codon:yes gene_type:complete
MLFKKKIQKCYVWTSDCSSNSGEGNLARLFIKKKLNTFDLKIITPKNTFQGLWINPFLDRKYASPFVGIIWCWINFFKNKKIAYINYLPLWNCFIFLLLPPGTILGPITGGANYKKNEEGYFVRKHIFPKLYKISELLLNLRSSEIIFSTSLLKNYLFKKTIKKSKFNFIFNYYRLNTKQSKNIDILIYYRNHINKKKFFPYSLIQKLKNFQLKIYVVGDHLNIPFVINYGRIDNVKLINLLKKTKYSISSDENLYSLFFMECINNYVKVITDYSNFKKISHFKNNFVFLNYKKIQNLNWLKKT